MSRGHLDIDATIKRAEAWLGALYAEFDRGKSVATIAKDRGLTYATVQGICWRAGRTDSGRTAIRHRLRAIRPGVDQVSA